MEMIKSGYRKVKGYCRQARDYVVGGSMTLVSGSALAEVSDYDGITGAVDWTDVTAAMITIFAAIAGVYVVFKGSKLVLRAIRGA